MSRLFCRHPLRPRLPQMPCRRLWSQPWPWTTVAYCRWPPSLFSQIHRSLCAPIIHNGSHPCKRSTRRDTRTNMRVRSTEQEIDTKFLHKHARTDRPEDCPEKHDCRSLLDDDSDDDIGNGDNGISARCCVSRIRSMQM